MSLLDAPAAPHYFTPEHVQFRASLRDWVAREITPHVNTWDEAQGFPRELYKKASAMGLLGLDYPEPFGGTPADLFYHLILSEELARPGCGGVAASLMSHSIGLPPVRNFGSAALQARVIPPVLAGDKIAAVSVLAPKTRAPTPRVSTTSSTAKKSLSPRACGLTSSPWRCAPTRPIKARVASRRC